MKCTNYSQILIFIIYFVFASNNKLYSQEIDLKYRLPNEYEYNIRKEREQDDILATSYEAFDPVKKIAPFEIIVTEMPTSLMETERMVEGLRKTIRNNYQDSKLILIKKDDSSTRSRYLYKISNNLSTVLILMIQQKGIFTMIEVEFHPVEFNTVALERWQKIFWDL